MNVRALQCFIKVYERRSVNAAAKEVFLSPQGLSKVIKQLEVDLDADLFRRGAQGMEATESGELLYARARHICYLMEDIKKEIGVINGSTGALNVFVSYATATVIPPDLLLRFTEENPAVRVRLREFPDEQAAADLFQEEADVGLVMGQEGIKDCQYDLLLPGRTVAVVAPGHPLAGRSSVSLADLKDEPLVLRIAGEGRESPVLDRAAELGLSLRVHHETGSLETLHRLAASGRTVGLSTNLIEASLADDRLRVVPLTEAIPENISLVSRKREMPNKAVTLFRSYLLNLVKSRR